MAFILSAQRHAEDLDDISKPFRQYRDYLRSKRALFPPGAYALATSDWYYNFHDYRCPHDSWLVACTIGEPSSGERDQERSTSLRIKLLGAYHDGHIELFYPQVYAYQMSQPDAAAGHGDWRYDEFRLSERGRLLHEIEWRGGLTDVDAARWLIEACGVELRWHPLDERPPDKGVTSAHTQG